jgi:hypothetical protein
MVLQRTSSFQLLKKGTQINQMMIELRENPLKKINGERVIMVEDQSSI